MGFLVVRGLNKDSEALTHAAIDMLCALMHPMHEDYDLKQEQHNKSSLLGNSSFLINLLDKWSHYAVSGFQSPDIFFYLLSTTPQIVKHTLFEPSLYGNRGTKTKIERYQQKKASSGICAFFEIQQHSFALYEGAVN